MPLKTKKVKVTVPVEGDAAEMDKIAARIKKRLPDPAPLLGKSPGLQGDEKFVDPNLVEITRLLMRLHKLEAEYAELRGDLVRFSGLFSKYFGIAFEKEVREILVKKQGAFEDKSFGE